MVGQGTKIHLHTEVSSYRKASNGQIEVKFATYEKVLDEKSGRYVKAKPEPTAEHTELFDTVMVATGRTLSKRLPALRNLTLRKLESS